MFRLLRCCEETFHIESKQIRVDQSQVNETNLLKYEILTCPNSRNSSDLSLEKSNLNHDEEDRKLCEYGTFQDYRVQHGNAKLVALGDERKTITVNRTWLDLPNLQIPVQSKTYCVS